METTKQYQIVDGTYYHADTPQGVIHALEEARKRGEKVQIWYGENGVSWNDENHMHGYIGRSTGLHKIPLIISPRSKYGGPALLDECIIRVWSLDYNCDLYCAPDYKPSKFEIKPCTDTAGHSHEVHINGELYSRHKTELSAKRLVQKMYKRPQDKFAAYEAR